MYVYGSPPIIQIKVKLISVSAFELVPGQNGVDKMKPDKVFASKSDEKIRLTRSWIDKRIFALVEIHG